MPTDPRNEPEIDLHGLRPEQALRRLEQGLHAARVRRAERVRVITGRGWGNKEQKPVLRGQVERWLRGEGGRRYGVRELRVAARGGALDLVLAPPGSGSAQGGRRPRAGRSRGS